MSIKVCVAPNLISTVNGIGLARTWFPRIVKEAFLESTKDGEIERSPDPVTMIEGDLTFFNNSDADLQMWVHVLRAPRSIVTTNPVTVVIHDSWSWAVGVNPQADYPSVNQDSFGGKLQIDKASTSGEDLKFGRYFLDGDDCETSVDIGLVPAMESLHFRYRAAVQTPGVWTTPTETTPMYEAKAFWTRLQAFTIPEVALP